MPVTYKNIKPNYADLEEFKETAIKRINEQYGRVEPYDIFDFSETKDEFKCVAYREGEANIPEEQEAGEVLSQEAKASAQIAEVIIEEDAQGIIEGEKAYTLDQVLSATDAALALAEAEGVDIQLINGTGKDGNVTKSDVEKYITDHEKLNNAPEEDNANAITDPNNQ